MRPFALGALVVAGIVAGFGGALVFIRILDRSSPAPFEVAFQLKAERPWQVQLGPGWGATSIRGTLLSDKTARLGLPLDRLPERDMVLDVDLWLERALASARLEVSANGKPIGAVAVSGPGTYRVLLPAASVGRSKVIEIGFATDAPSETILVEAISLRDVTGLANASGHVDACAIGNVVGWAMSDDLPVPVVIRRESGGVFTVMPSHSRADIKRSGRPLGVGFAATLVPPLKPGERVDVTLPNGNALAGSPCRG